MFESKTEGCLILLADLALADAGWTTQARAAGYEAAANSYPQADLETSYPCLTMEMVRRPADGLRNHLALHMLGLGT